MSTNSPHWNRLTKRSSRPFELARRRVAGEDDLLTALVQGIEDVEEFFLGAILAAHELDVVHQEQIHFVAVIGGELVDAVMLDGLHELAVEGFGRDVPDLFPGVFGHDEVADGLQQVGLAQAHAAVDQQGIEFGSAGILGHGQGGGIGELGVAADHEFFEGVIRVQVDERHSGEGMRRSAGGNLGAGHAAQLDARFAAIGFLIAMLYQAQIHLAQLIHVQVLGYGQANLELAQIENLQRDDPLGVDILGKLLLEGGEAGRPGVQGCRGMNHGGENIINKPAHERDVWEARIGGDEQVFNI